MNSLGKFPFTSCSGLCDICAVFKHLFNICDENIFREWHGERVGLHVASTAPVAVQGNVAGEVLRLNYLERNKISTNYI